MKTLTLTLVMFSSGMFAQTFQRTNENILNPINDANNSTNTMEEGVFILKVQDLDFNGIQDGQIVFLDVSSDFQGFYFWKEVDLRWNKIKDPKTIYSDAGITKIYFN